MGDWTSIKLAYRYILKKFFFKTFFFGVVLSMLKGKREWGFIYLLGGMNYDPFSVQQCNHHPFVISLLVYNNFGTTSLYRVTGLTVFINV